MLDLTTVELSFWVGYFKGIGGDYRMQMQVATLTSVVSGFTMKKPLTPKRLMPEFPWGKKAPVTKKAVRSSIRQMALDLKRDAAGGNE